MISQKSFLLFVLFSFCFLVPVFPVLSMTRGPGVTGYSQVSVWTTDPSETLLLRVRPGRHVGYSKLVVYSLGNESIVIDGQSFQLNETGFYYREVTNVSSYELRYRSLQATVVIDDTMVLTASEVVVEYAFRLIGEAGVYFLPSALAAVIIFPYLAVKAKQKFEAVFWYEQRIDK